MEDRVDDAVHTLHVNEADHGPSTPSNLYKTAFNHIGGAQFLPQVPWKAEEGQ